MYPSRDSDQRSSWMSPADVSRAELASMALDVFNGLENLGQLLYEDVGSRYQPSVTSLQGPTPTMDSRYPYPIDFYSSPTIPQNTHQILPSWQSTASNYSLSPTNTIVHTNSSNSPAQSSPPAGITNQRRTDPGSPSAGITNQRRTDSVNIGGSRRRAAPADKLCPFCPASFTRNERLKYHIESVHLKLPPEFGCHIQGCNRVFRQRSDLLRHQRTVHQTLSPNPPNLP